jgi:hypothetical protein
MSEESEWWKGIKKQRQNEAADRRNVAASEFASVVPVRIGQWRVFVLEHGAQLFR